MADELRIAGLDSPRLGQRPVEAREHDVLAVAREGGIVLVGGGLGTVINYLVVLLLTRMAGIEAWGNFRFAWTIVAILSVLAELGLRQGVVRFGAGYTRTEDRPKLGTLVTRSLRLTLVVGAAASLGLMAVAPWLSEAVLDKPHLATILTLAALSIPFAAITSILLASTQALKVTWMLVLVNRIALPVCALALAVVLLTVGLGVLGIVMAYVAATVLMASLAYFLTRRVVPGLLAREASAGAKSDVSPRTLLRFSLPLLVVNLLQYSNERTETIVLGIFGDMAQVGTYDVALRTAGFEVLLLQSLIVIFAPFVADLYERQSLKELESLYKTISQWSFTGGLVIFALFALFAAPILRLFDPSIGGAGVLVLIVLGLGQLVNAAVGPAGCLLAMTGRSGLVLFNTVALLTISVVLDVTLIPRYGLIGAGIAGFVAITVLNLLRLAEVYYAHRMHPFKGSYWKPMAAGGVAAGAILLLKASLPVGLGIVAVAALSGLFLIVFALALYRFGLSREDRIIWSAIRRRLARLPVPSIRQ